MMNPSERPLAIERRRRQYLMQTRIFMGLAMALILLCGLGLYGWVGVPLLGILGAITLGASARITPQKILSLRSAVPLSREKGKTAHLYLDRLSEKAGLAHRPKLYVMPGRGLNAFAIGEGENAAISLTIGLLQTMSNQELEAVIAHEIGHLKSGDTRLIMIFEVINRLMSVMFLVGFICVIVYLPAFLAGNTPVAPWAVFLMLLAPTLVSYLQFAARRTREYEADREGVALVGSSKGMIQALTRLLKRQGRYWNDSPIPNAPSISLKSSHPTLDSRIARLQGL
jgi:heat shock protein HtpX